MFYGCLDGDPDALIRRGARQPKRVVYGRMRRLVHQKSFAPVAVYRRLYQRGCACGREYDGSGAVNFSDGGFRLGDYRFRRLQVVRKRRFRSVRPRDRRVERRKINDTPAVAGGMEGNVFVQLYQPVAEHYFDGFIVGNNSTSRMDAESVNNIIILSIPIPNPPVGGKPYSNAVT